MLSPKFPAGKGPDQSKAPASKPGFTFGKKERLTDKRGIQQLVKRGRRARSKNLQLYYAHNGLTYSRLCVSTPSAIGNAVLRNRCRRRIKEIYRTNKDLLKCGSDMLLVVKKDISKLEFCSIRNEFIECISNISDRKKADKN